MSDAYERERQNNSRLDELSAKVSALRGVTIDIYDNARDQGVIDSTVRAHILHVRGATHCLLRFEHAFSSLHGYDTADCVKECC